MNAKYSNPDKLKDSRLKEGELDSSPNTHTEHDKQNKTGQDGIKHFKVLHKDGSFADLPAEDTEGTGALDGTVGLVT